MSWTTGEQKYGDNYIDCFDRIEGLNITVKEMDFRGIGFYNEASAVHKSDYLRWWLLYEQGGLWADMDILFIKPMDELVFNTPAHSNVNAVFCINNLERAKGYIHSIGFLMGGKHNDYFKTIHKRAEERYSQESYQCMGSLLCNELFPTVDSTRKGNTVSYNLPMDTVYAYNANQVGDIFTPSSPARITENTMGIHWYGGSNISGAYLNATNGGLYADYGNTIIDQYISKIRKEIE
jgi:hypothetical protein